MVEACVESRRACRAALHVCVRRCFLASAEQFEVFEEASHSQEFIGGASFFKQHRALRDFEQIEEIVYARGRA
jgi:hypothetical protein